MKRQNFSSFLGLAVASLLITPVAAKADVWTVYNTWSAQTEIAYQTWLQSFAQVDMFVKPTIKVPLSMLDTTGALKIARGDVEIMQAVLAERQLLAPPSGPENNSQYKEFPSPYYGLKTDCADTVYSLRVIFSAKFNLPWAIKNPKDKTQLITQATKDFDKISEAKGERLKAFIKSLLGKVSTRTIANDTYPISVNRIVPGTIILTSHKNHHSWTIVELKSTGNPRLIFNSTVGKQSGSKVQERISWPNPFWVFEPEEKPVDKNNPDLGVIRVPVYFPGSYAGLRYWIPIDQLMNDPKLLPGYSVDQYALDLNKWKQTLTRKLAKKAESIQDIVQRNLTDACSDIKQRVDAVFDVQKHKAATPGVMCLNKADYDEYSTPSRDRRLFDAIMLARTYLKFGLKTQGENIFTPEKLAQFKKIFADPLAPAKEESAAANNAIAIDANSICQVKVGTETLDFAEIKRRIFRSYISSNPNEDVLGRWGGRKGIPSDTAKKCTNYDGSYAPYDLDRSEKEAQDEVDAYSNH